MMAKILKLGTLSLENIEHLDNNGLSYFVGKLITMPLRKLVCRKKKGSHSKFSKIFPWIFSLLRRSDDRKRNHQTQECSIEKCVFHSVHQTSRYHSRRNASPAGSLRTDADRCRVKRCKMTADHSNCSWH